MTPAGYRKIHKNQTLWFSSIFMTPGTQKSDTSISSTFMTPYMKVHKIQTLQFSWPRVQENPQKSDALIFFNFHDPGYMKINKNQTLHFSSIFMILGTWKLTKIRRFDFIQFSWPVHENSQKSDAPILFNFHDPGYMKIHKNQTLQFYSIFMTPGTWKLTKIRHFNFLHLSWPRVHENPQKSDNSIFFNFHDFWVIT